MPTVAAPGESSTHHAFACSAFLCIAPVTFAQTFGPSLGPFHDPELARALAFGQLQHSIPDDGSCPLPLSAQRMLIVNGHRHALTTAWLDTADEGWRWQTQCTLQR